jgi:hypothetical protein
MGCSCTTSAIARRGSLARHATSFRDSRARTRHHLSGDTVHNTAFYALLVVDVFKAADIDKEFRALSEVDGEFA